MRRRTDAYTNPWFWVFWVTGFIVACIIIFGERTAGGVLSHTPGFLIGAVLMYFIDRWLDDRHPLS